MTEPKWKTRTRINLYTNWKREAIHNGNKQLAKYWTEKLEEVERLTEAEKRKLQDTQQSGVIILGVPWTPSEDEELKKYRRIGVPYREIGERLGRSRSACLGRYARLMKVC